LINANEWQTPLMCGGGPQEFEDVTTSFEQFAGMHVSGNEEDGGQRIRF